jgi:peptidoglycan/LPS O-acetylase OafA/YrhL
MFNSEIRENERAKGASLETSYKEVAGLDTIRFLAAMCVAFGHGALFPVAAYVPEKTGLWAILVGLNNSAFNGVAAVMIFFVISGFCIHYKYACGQRFLTVPFLSRRLLRIAIPVLAAIALANLLGAQAQGALDAVLWSLYYEMIYYLIYPALRILFSALGIWACIACSTLISIVLIAFNWGLAYYWQFPVYYGWLVPFPAWLLGCLLAEKLSKGNVVHAGHEIWTWRLVGLSYSAFVQAYFFHGPIKIGMPALLYPFIAYSFFWLDREIAHMRSVGAVPVLEWAGRWSYSIYLMHGMILVSLSPTTPIGPALIWAIKLVAILAGSYCFYLIVERPAHQLARSVSYRISRQPSR